MRLRRIEMMNFRRHRDTRIEMPDGIIALLGRNGAGKSSILEAIAFGLFGSDAARTNKSLVRWDGAAPGDGVRVTLDIELGGQALRIVRELKGKNLTPTASVEADGVLLVAPGAGSNEAATREMERRLGMDAAALFTTLFARQKELSRLADENPADRKRLLLRMLGIDHVDQGIVRARDARRRAEDGLAAVRRLLVDPVGLDAAVASAEQRLQDAETAARHAEAAWADRQKRLEERRGRVEALAAQEAARAALRNALDAAKQKESHAAHLSALHAQALAEADQAASRARDAAPLATLLPERMADLQSAKLAGARAAQRRRALAVVAQAETELARLKAERSAFAKPPPVADLAALAARFATSQAQAAQARAGATHAQARVVELEQRLANWRHLGEDAPCPVCERPLAGHLGRLQHDGTAALDAARKTWRDAVAASERHEMDLVAARQALAAAEAVERERERNVMRASALAERAESVRSFISRLVAEVPADETVPDLPALERAAEEARRAHETQVAAQALAVRVPAILHALQAAQRDQREAVATRATIEGQLATVADPARLLAEGRAALALDAAAERTAERVVQTALHAVQLARQTRDQSVQRRTEEAERQRQAAVLEREAQEWAALASARNDGLLDRFRDHLVDRIGPAIAVEASRLLARFTGGRYTEILLDADYQVFVCEQGVPYALERFSGGEADLVHLALRLAVSRLLAERAGTELRFLALDEVFGSLDQNRRDLVVAALGELGNLYSQVLVVSHLEGLQEALGTVLRVEERDGEAVLTLQNG